MNGTYSFVYSGPTGVGLGVFRITDGNLVGVDLSGVRYRGTAIANPDGTIKLAIDQTVPAGTFLVNGVSSQDIPMTRSLSVEAPSGFGDGEPFKAAIQPSPVTLMVKQIPDDPWATYADGVSVDIRPLAKP